MLKNGTIVKIIGVMIVSTKIVFGQLVSINAVSRSNPKPQDTIRYLNIPERSENAMKGSEFVDLVADLSRTDREKAVVREILSGNVPSFSRKLKPLKVVETVNGKSYELLFSVTYDYIAIGSDADYLYIPMTPSTAQYLADRLNCSLPTKKLVDLVYANAEIKLKPQPIPPSDLMTTVPIFWQHTDSVKRQVFQMGHDRLADKIFAGHKKDIIISNNINSTDGGSDSVIIYGWHLDENNPIQPVYYGHAASYADYSHGVRFIAKPAFVNGDLIQVDAILKDPNLSILLSGEGVIKKPYYPGM